MAIIEIQVAVYFNFLFNNYCRFHDFDVHNSSKSDDRANDYFPIMIGKIPVNGNQDQDKPTNQGVEDNVDGNQQGGNQQVGETVEETFMCEVRGTGETRT